MPLHMHAEEKKERDKKVHQETSKNKVEAHFEVLKSRDNFTNKICLCIANFGVA